MHSGICGGHIGSRALAAEVFWQGCYWPSFIDDASKLVTTCQACQKFLPDSKVASEPFVEVYDNDLEWGWSWDRENNGNTGDTRIFRQVQASQSIIALCSVFLYCSWQLMPLSSLLDLSSRGASTPPFISKGARLQGR
jgi:hypothetical protein